MQKGGFGRKGALPGGGFGQRGTASLAPGAGDDLAARREAFLAEERAEHPADTPDDEREEYNGPIVIPGAAFTEPANRKSLVIAYVLWYFLGLLGAHRFYLGATESGFVQLGMFLGSLVLIAFGNPIAYLGGVLFIVAAIWLIADLFLIPGVRRQVETKDGSRAFQEVFA